MFDAEAYLELLEPLGMRFGLERMRALTAALGDPQLSYETIHVVGTNGKSSVTEITAALLQAHGRSSGAYLSPHLERWRERIRVSGRELGGAAFATAVEAVAGAVERVNGELEEGDAITQFEAATAAAFVALANARVETAVIEAGLGGRLDATNLLDSRVTVLTTIGLEHTEWLGSTELEIAAEKLAVLQTGTTLVLGTVSDDVRELARRTARERSAALVELGVPEVPATLRAAAPYVRHNFALARRAAEAALGGLDPDRVEEVAAGLELHGRMEVLEGDPPLILDAAHNPDGARALAEALPTAAAGRPVFAAVALLADKDADAYFAALAPVLAGVVVTEVDAERLARGGRPGARSAAGGDLAEAARAATIGRVEVVREAAGAIARAQDLAREAGGVALVTGSHYLLSAWAPAPASPGGSRTEPAQSLRFEH